VKVVSIWRFVDGTALRSRLSRQKTAQAALFAPNLLPNLPKRATGLIVWDQPGGYRFLPRFQSALLRPKKLFIASNKTGAPPVNLKSGESIAHAQLFPVRLHELLYCPSDRKPLATR